MNRVKTFIKYLILIILFWILSDVLINYAFSTKKEENENQKETQVITQETNQQENSN